MKPFSAAGTDPLRGHLRPAQQRANFNRVLGSVVVYQMDVRVGGVALGSQARPDLPFGDQPVEGRPHGLQAKPGGKVDSSPFALYVSALVVTPLFRGVGVLREVVLDRQAFFLIAASS